MKARTILCILLLALAGSLYAQQGSFSYQGMLLDAAKRPVSGERTITVRLYDAPSDGTAIHTESFATKVENGVFSTIVNSQKSLKPRKQYWLGVSVDNGEEMTPRTALTPIADAVTSLNGATGELEFKGGPGTFVETEGRTITITSMPVGNQEPQAGKWDETGGNAAGANSYVGTNNNTVLRAQVRNSTTINNSVILNNNWSIQRDAGGDTRGTDAVDLQHDRSANNEVASGENAVISGGERNTASNKYTTVAGGYRNKAEGESSSIGGGRENLASHLFSTVAGGASNSAISPSSTIAGGRNNTAAGDFSTIPGGLNLVLDASADRSFGFNASNSTGTLDMTISASNTAVFGNADLWLANTDNTAHALRFYEAQSTSGAFPATGTHYAAIKAPVLSNNYTLTLPENDGEMNQVLTTDGSGNLSWVNGGHIDWHQEGGNAAGTTSYVGTNNNTLLRLQVRDGETINNTVILNTNGSIQRDESGDARGSYAVDLQSVRAEATQVASGDYSVIAGGSYNIASGLGSFIGGGGVDEANLAANGNAGNVASGDFSTIAGGFAQDANGAYSFIGGGADNDATGYQTVVSGGLDNDATGDYSVIAGGKNNRASGLGSFVGGGGYDGFDGANEASGVNASVLGGWRNNTQGDYSVILGGWDNVAEGGSAFIGSGSGNHTYDDPSSADDFGIVVGGLDNHAYPRNVVLGGEHNQSGSETSVLNVVGGGGSNTAWGGWSSVLGGGNNVAAGYGSSVLGGADNAARGMYSSVLGGWGLSLREDATSSFGYLAGLVNGGFNYMYVDAPNVGVFANVDIWIANNNNDPGEIRFYEAQSTLADFPGDGTNYTAFKAGAQDADITYTLPAADGTSGQVLTTDGSGMLSWANTPSGSNWYIQNGTSTQADANFNISGKGSSAATVGSDPSSTLTTKGYVDDAAATLTANLNSEIARAVAAEATLQAEKATMTDLANEVARAVAAETSLQTAIDARATAEDLNSEIVRAIAAEAALETEKATTVDLTNEVARAVAAEDALQAEINTEETTRSTADATLTANLNSEITRAMAAEDALQAAINSCTTLVSTNWGTTGNSISSGNFLGTTNAEALVIKSNNTEWMRITSSGMVGMGTTTPDQPVHMYDGRSGLSASQQVLRVESSRSGATDGTFIGIVDNTGGTRHTGTSIGSVNGNMILQSNNTERVRITSEGRVGMGTSTPITKLDVASGAEVVARLQSTLSGSSIGSLLQMTDAGGSSAYIGNVGGHMVIEPDGGFVGIGTRTPLLTGLDHTYSGLTITGTANGGATGSPGPAYLIAQRLGNSSWSSNIFELRGYEASTQVARFTMFRDGAADAAGIAFHTQPTGGAIAERMRVTSTGNVGIGSTTPGSKLEVENGDIYINHATGANGLILRSPNGTCWRITIDNTGALVTTPLGSCP